MFSYQNQKIQLEKRQEQNSILKSIGNIYEQRHLIKDNHSHGNL